MSFVSHPALADSGVGVGSVPVAALGIVAAGPCCDLYINLEEKKSFSSCNICSWQTIAMS